MKRLTEKRKYKDGRKLKGDWQALYGADVIYEATDHLAEYEDIGLSPEEIKQVFEKIFIMVNHVDDIDLHDCIDVKELALAVDSMKDKNLKQ